MSVSPHPPEGVLVIGVGNPLRRDDSAGWRVTQAIAHRWPRVVVRLGQQLLPEWAEDLSSTEFAVIVDASSSRKVTLRRVTPVRDMPLVDGHMFGPEELLALTKAVYGSSAELYMIEAPAADFRFGQTLSPLASAGVDAAIRLLDELCVSWSLASTVRHLPGNQPPQKRKRHF